MVDRTFLEKYTRDELFAVMVEMMYERSMKFNVGQIKQFNKYQMVNYPRKRHLPKIIGRLECKTAN